MENEVIEVLIERVKSHEFLYDVTNKDYKNVGLKASVWESIGRELNLTGEAVRNKWKTIRDGYTKNKKLLKTSSYVNKKSSYYVWGSQLTFLDNYNTTRALEKPASPSQIPQMTPELAQYFISPVSPNILSTPQELSVPTTSTSRYSQRQLRRHNPVRLPKNSINDDVRKVIHYLKKKEHDGIDHLFLSYAETFKKFPAREQAVMKIELAKMFSNTELKLIKSTNSTHSLFLDMNEVTPGEVDGEDINVKEEDDEELSS